jgi:CHAD domain-containing protein
MSAYSFWLKQSMAKQLKQNVPGTESIRKIVCTQTDKVLETLDGKHVRLSDERVHDVRKQLKRVRAELRLLRDAVGDRIYHKENSRYRDAARPLTEVRDAKVLIDTLDKLAGENRKDLPAAELRKVRHVLQTHYRDARRKVFGDASSLTKVKKALEVGRQQADKLRLGKKGWSVIGAGVKRVYRAGRDALAAAQRDRSIENLHECRKQVKYLWHQLQVLESIWPDVLEKTAEQTHELADLLGDDHDLVVLGEKLFGQGGLVADRNAAAGLAKAVDRRRQELQAKAFALGRRLFAEKPKSFAARLENYWHIWRCEATKVDNT